MSAPRKPAPFSREAVDLMRRREPGLSETLTGPKAPNACQSCGVEPEDRTMIRRWIECDAEDRPTTVRVFLCVRCSDRLIPPHARLYESEHPWVPAPGVMPCCVACRHRRDLSCLHPAQRSLGGPGLRVHWSPGPSGFVCGEGGCQNLATVMPRAEPTCEGRETSRG